MGVGEKMKKLAGKSANLCFSSRFAQMRIFMPAYQMIAYSKKTWKDCCRGNTKTLELLYEIYLQYCLLYSSYRTRTLTSKMN